MVAETGYVFGQTQSIKSLNLIIVSPKQNKAMQPVANGKARATRYRTHQIRTIKRLIVFLSLIALHSPLTSKGQSLSIDVKAASIERVFELIEKQSNFRFIYSQASLQQAKPITLTIKNASIEAVLTNCFRGQPLSYTRDEKYIIVKTEVNKAPTVQTVVHDLRGKVINSSGEPVAGVSVTVKGTTITVTTDADGAFEIKGISPLAILDISGAETDRQEVRVENRNFIVVTINARISELDKVVMIAYGTTTKRLSTGNISKVTAADIERQPVSNPIATLSGRVPGLVISQNSGVPGTGFKVEIRGRSSLDLSLSTNDPLYVIDGIPFAPGSTIISQLTSAANSPRSIANGGISPLSTINPADIESIEVLKDADATAIYGSRGANGVILITTKKGQSGRTKITASVYYGRSRVARPVSMLSTPEYLQMRREAFANDGVAPTLATAPDLLLWDSTRQTDFVNLLTGGTASAADAQVSVSGGNATTNFIFGGSYNRQTTVFPGDFSASRVGTHFSLNHGSSDRRFTASFSGNYTSTNSNLLRTDLSTYINLPPNFPALYDSAGGLVWIYKGVSFPTSLPNPLADQLKKYQSTIQHLNLTIQLQFRIIGDLYVKVSTGMNLVHNIENLITPRQSIAPTSVTMASSSFANNQSKSAITEPQLEYRRKVGEGMLKVMAGATLQHTQNEGSNVTGSNYSSDLLLHSLTGAGLITASNTFNEYKYAALFGRVNYNFRERYIVNMTARRDGSSRFGAGKQFANFGAIGAAWIFSKEKLLSYFKFFSYGKLRSSYGITGSDQIGDYKFLDSWTNTSNPYQGVSGLRPTRLFNPDYRWERTRKLELALDLGFLSDNILFSVAFFRNLSGNQLINYQLPSQTGFNSIVQNFPALVRNTGFEFSGQVQAISRKNFKWQISSNLSLPRNKLLAFPGLRTSTYFQQYEVGQPLSVIKTFQYNGINPATGLYQFRDVDSNGSYNFNDRLVNGNLQLRFYGGLQQTLTYKNLVLDVFFEFRKQRGFNYLSSQSTFVPGFMINQPSFVFSRWQKPGDVAQIQRYTSRNGTAAYTAATAYLLGSDAVYSDASFARLKNMSLTWNLPGTWLKKAKIEGVKVYLLGQNLITLTDYKGADPENQNLYVLPPLKTVAAGIQIIL